MNLTPSQFHRLMDAARDSVFAWFWRDMIPVMHATGLAAMEVLTGRGSPSPYSPSVEEAWMRVRTSECPFTSEEAMEGSLRTLKQRAGIEGL